MTPRRLFVAASLVFAMTIGVVTIPVRGAGWNPRLAAKYLDDRQRDWFAWPQAKSPDGPCVSCHTGMPYLLARPALRRLLKETPRMPARSRPERCRVSKRSSPRCCFRRQIPLSVRRSISCGRCRRLRVR